MTVRAKITFVCSHCGSDDVLCDAYASWDNAAQQWEVSSLFDKGGFCAACDGESRLIDKPLTQEESTDE